MRSSLTAASIFFLIALALGGILPLWLDEIIQLRETRNTTPAQLFASLPNQPGSAPLGYLIQQTSLNITGYSARLARFPSALFVAGAVFVTGLIGMELGLAWPWLAAGLFALFPETLRYACESRVYSQALLFSTLATWAFIRLNRNPGWRPAALYGLILAAAIYTQPYAIFVGFAHLAWVVLKRKNEPIFLTAAAVACAIAAFVPWYLLTRSHWSAGLAGTDVHFVFSAKTPLMLFREVAGAGYWGSGLLLILCALAAKQRKMLGLLVAIPILLALLADAVSGYFVAARQILWVLPAIALLAAMGIEHKPRIAQPVAFLLAAVCLWQNYRFFTGPRENFELAANTLAAEVTQGACLRYVPAADSYLYEFFRPELKNRNCPATRTVLTASPYTTTAAKHAAADALTTAGYRHESTRTVGQSEISAYSR